MNAHFLHGSFWYFLTKLTITQKIDRTQDFLAFAAHFTSKKIYYTTIFKKVTHLEIHISSLD